MQKGEKRVQVESPAQPFVAIGYKRPDQLDKDDPVFDVLDEILSGERTGLLYTELVRDKQIALAAGAESSFPGGKYPGLFILFLVPNQGHTVEENEKAAYEIIERVKTRKGHRRDAEPHQDQSARVADSPAGQQLRHGRSADVLLR